MWAGSESPVEGTGPLALLVPSALLLTPFLPLIPQACQAAAVQRAGPCQAPSEGLQSEASHLTLVL